MTALAEALGRLKWDTAVIDNTASVQSPSSFLEQAVEQIRWRRAIMIGHSGAGAFLPTVAARTQAIAAVFVDAILPPANGPVHSSVPFLEFVDTLPTVYGQLPPWSEWWPSGTMEQLIADEKTRRAVLADMPVVKRSFYDHPVDVPPDWNTRPCCYLQLSPAYDEERDRAASWGWPTQRLAGRHLDLIEKAPAVAAQIIELVDRLKRSGS